MKLLSLSAALLVAATDLKVKDVMRELSPDIVIYNKGFAANRLEDKPRVVACVSAALTAALTAYSLSDGASEKFAACFADALSNGLILGGAVSNTSERIVRGKVTDYIPLGKYVYNIGDFAIYAGAALKIAASLIRR